MQKKYFHIFISVYSISSELPIVFFSLDLTESYILDIHMCYLIVINDNFLGGFGHIRAVI